MSSSNITGAHVAPAWPARRSLAHIIADLRLEKVGPKIKRTRTMYTVGRRVLGYLVGTQICCAGNRLRESQGSPRFTPYYATFLAWRKVCRSAYLATLYRPCQWPYPTSTLSSVNAAHQSRVSPEFLEVNARKSAGAQFFRS